MPTHAAAAALFTVNLLRLLLRSLTHTQCTRSLALTLSSTHTHSLSRRSSSSSSAACKGPKNPSQALIFSFSFLFFASSLLRFVCSALPLSLSHFLVCYTRQRWCRCCCNATSWRRRWQRSHRCALFLFARII